MRLDSGHTDCGEVYYEGGPGSLRLDNGHIHRGEVCCDGG